MKKSLIIILSIITVVVIFAAGIWTGIWLAQPVVDTAMAPTDANEFALIQQAWNITRANYVDTTATQPQSLAYGSIDGMINSLGDTGHSTFLTPEQVKMANNLEQGNFEGVGIEVQFKNNNVIVVTPINGSPAQKAGIRSGDIILKVDGKPVTSVNEAVQLILGPAGTSVTLTIQSASGQIREVNLTRAKINFQIVSWRMIPETSIVHLKIDSFSKGATDQLDTALTSIKSQKASGIILDLRNNPGGLLDEAVGFTSRFLSSGNVLLEKDIKGQITPVPVIKSRITVTDLPMDVLINHGTASAAEIVAGALHDAGRAKLIGETTFGTGTVLEQFPLADGSAIMLAVREWLTPSGETIWHTGLSPDITVALAAGTSELTPDTEQGLTLDQIKASGDEQLLSALNILMQ
jgi:carboxyl-terminal processing protease